MFAFGQEQRLVAAGKTFRLDKLRLKYTLAFRDWIATKIGDPFALAQIFVDKLAPAEALKLIKEAESLRDQLQGFSVFSPLGLRWLYTEEGVQTLATLLLSKHHAGASEDDVTAVADEIAGTLMEILDTASGQAPNEAGPAAEESPPGASTGTPSSAAAGTAAPV